MEIRFYIEMPRPTLRGAAQIFGPLALMRDGVGLIVSGGAEEFTRNLSYATRQFGPPDQIPDDLLLSRLLEQMGEIVLYRHDWPVLPTEQQFIMTQVLLQMPPSGDDPQLVSVRQGSLEGVIEDAIEYVGRFFRRLLESTNSIVRGGEGRDMKEVLGGIADVSQQPRARTLGAGIVMVAAANLRRSYEAHGVAGIKVE